MTITEMKDLSKEADSAIATIERMVNELTEMRDDFQEKVDSKQERFDNMSLRSQESPAGQRLEQAINDLQEDVDELSFVDEFDIEALNNFLSGLDRYIERVEAKRAARKAKAKAEGAVEPEEEPADEPAPIEA